MVGLLLGLVLTAPAEGADQAQPRAFGCCTHPGLTTALREYLDLHVSLARGDEQRRNQWHVSSLNRALKGLRLPGPDQRVVAAVTERAAALNGAPVAEVRRAFAAISRGFVVLALRHEGGPQVVAEAGCPERGGWLQRDLEAPKSPWGDGCARWRSE